MQILVVYTSSFTLKLIAGHRTARLGDLPNWDGLQTCGANLLDNISISTHKQPMRLDSN